jgi:hypothetical protein
MKAMNQICHRGAAATALAKLESPAATTRKPALQ